jgi:hypothetical protein
LAGSDSASKVTKSYPGNDIGQLNKSEPVCQREVGLSEGLSRAAPAWFSASSAGKVVFSFYVAWGSSKWKFSPFVLAPRGGGDIFESPKAVIEETLYE